MSQLENKKKVAILVGANIYNRKGLFNAVHERIKHLKEVADYQIDAYIISTYKSPLAVLLTRGGKITRPTIIDIEGIHYNILWLKNTIFGFILLHGMNKPDVFKIREFKKYVPLFKDYDLIEGHASGEYVWEIYKQIHIPFIMTWHGSDIHTMAFLSDAYQLLTAQLIERAGVNFFVSKALMDLSEQITNKGVKMVSYNGRNERFVEYDSNRKLELRKVYGVENNKVVAFVGNLISVKNIEVLPYIFRIIHDECPDVVFWMIGDGALRNTFELNSKDLPVKMWGNVDYEDMPKLMNAIDVLVLPSKNEGLPLVTVEALSCGCNVVGSRVGGVEEAIGIENTIPLNIDDFNLAFANKCISFLKAGGNQKLSESFDWNLTAKNENACVLRLLDLSKS